MFGAGGKPLYLTVNGVASYSHQDGLGWVVALSTATGTNAGKRSALYAYDAFGQPTTTITSAFGYAGQRLDPTTGLVYDRARFYSPALGRFVQPDPIGYKGGNNLYAYVGNDPLNLVDPSGLLKNQVGQAVYGLEQQDQADARAILSPAASVANFVDPGSIPSLGGSALAAEEVEAADVAASTPIGRSGNPIDVAPGTNQPGTVAGRDYTGHAFDQMQGRGIPSSAVENTIQNGVPGPGNLPGRTTYYNPANNLTAVTDSATGRVITVRQGPP